MSPQEKTQLYGVFEPLLRLTPKTTHDDLIEIYYYGITYIKNNFVNRTREEKSAAMYFLKLHYEKNGLQNINIEKIIIDFFTLYDNEYTKSKEEFSLISNEEQYLLTFAYRQFFKD